jgi:hypothetical protein
MYIHLTPYKTYINFLIQQARVRDYYGAEILYYFFELINVLKWKNLKLESCRPHRDLQFSYLFKSYDFLKVGSCHATPGKLKS